MIKRKSLLLRSEVRRLLRTSMEVREGVAQILKFESLLIRFHLGEARLSELEAIAADQRAADCFIDASSIALGYASRFHLVIGAIKSRDRFVVHYDLYFFVEGGGCALAVEGYVDTVTGQIWVSRVTNSAS